MGASAKLFAAVFFGDFFYSSVLDAAPHADVPVTERMAATTAVAVSGIY
jgi:hypothetical protein